MSCQHCGADLPPLAMFCGECGRSVSARAAVLSVESRPETPISARVDPAPILAAPQEPEREATPEPEPEPAQVVGRACSECGTEAYPDDRFCAECGHRWANDTVIIDALRAVPPAAVVAETVETRPATSVRRETPLENGERFVLQFSTGESYTVLGSGLAGRNPRPEPGEVVDHLVTIVDPGRSVSKTHLEFGQTDGEFWVSDRHSGNGTVIRESSIDPLVCVPGRRYPVRRGTRIDLGEQHLIVL